jgi:hypothetical protein
MLQGGGSRVRISMRSFDFFFNVTIAYSLFMVLGCTKPLNEMSTRNLPGGKGWPARDADNLTANSEPIMRILDVSQPYVPTWPVTGIALLCFISLHFTSIYSTLLYLTLFYFILLYFTLLHFTSLFFILFYCYYYYHNSYCCYYY